ncbi:hypothetical protein [Clostridium ihumii]|uniref:hypothetical protein n=1 Tax=Clostridium ihumii TaxID=1470356 RepID=UPI003D343540
MSHNDNIHKNKRFFNFFKKYYKEFIIVFIGIIIGSSIGSIGKVSNNTAEKINKELTTESELLKIKQIELDNLKIKKVELEKSITK